MSGLWRNMWRFMLAAVLLLTPSSDPLTVAPAGLTDCEGPLLVTRGGTYSGCWSSTIAGQPAVKVATTEPVTFTRCTITGPSILVISAVPNVKLTVTDCHLADLAPGASAQPDYAIRVSGFDYLRAEHNLIEGHGGVKASGWSGAPTASPVLVRYNRARRIDGRVSGANGATGKVNLTFVQLDNVRNAPGVEIAWNEVINKPFTSAVEDNISVFASGGTAGSPLDVHDNYIEGGYPVDPATGDYSGGGILLGDNGGEWSVARDNQVVATTNYGVAIAGGAHNRLYRNRVVASGVLPDGRTIAAQNVGVYVWSVLGTPTEDNDAFDNEAAWQGPAGRNDWWLPDCTGRCDNVHLGGEAPVTRSDEAAERDRWRDKHQRAGVTLGPRSP
jgi:hypothetical protein